MKKFWILFFLLSLCVILVSCGKTQGITDFDSDLTERDTTEQIVAEQPTLPLDHDFDSDLTERDTTEQIVAEQPTLPLDHDSDPMTDETTPTTKPSFLQFTSLSPSEGYWEEALGPF